MLAGADMVASGPLVVSLVGDIELPVSGVPVEEVASGALVESPGMGLPLAGAPPGMEALVSAGAVLGVVIGILVSMAGALVSAGAVLAEGELGDAGAEVSSPLLLQPTRARGAPRTTSARRQCFCKKCFIRNN